VAGAGALLIMVSQQQLCGLLVPFWLFMYSARACIASSKYDPEHEAQADGDQGRKARGDCGKDSHFGK
jgi:hypothetical protein